MTTKGLIELYGWRYTPFARLAGFVAILIFGILIAFGTSSQETSDEPAVNIEQAG